MGLEYIELNESEHDKILKLFTKDTAGEPETDKEFLYFGVYYRKVEDKPELALVNYNRAAILGNPEAFLVLGQIYRKKGDCSSAVWYYKEALKRGVKDAYFWLGFLYRHDIKDLEKAEIYFKKAAEHGDSYGFLQLGHIYDQRKDYENSEYYYRQAHLLKNTEAIDKLLDLYEKQKKYETAFIFAFENNHPNIIKYLNLLTFPITNKNEIYPILEIIKLPKECNVSGHIVTIIQEAVERKIKLMCEIAYRYKNYNSTK